MASQDEETHTPLPWSLSQGFDLRSFGGSAPAIYVAGSEPGSIGIKLATPFIEGAWADDPEAAANAAFIVRACNSHYDLLEALRPFSDALGSIADKDDVRWPDNDTIEHSGAAEEITWGDLRCARAAIAKALGQ
jgi:hypothetical protein